MSLLGKMAILAVRQVLADRADALLAFVGDHFSDNTGRLERALCAASDRSWRCLELALAGPTWWASLTGWVRSKDERQLEKHIRVFLGSIPPSELPADSEDFHRCCLAELRKARASKLIPGQDVRVTDLVDQSQHFARYGDPVSLLEQDRLLVAGLAEQLYQSGYTNLARYINLRPGQNQPLLVQSVRFFFRREVESDPQLAAALTVEKLDGLTTSQQDGFAALEEILARHGSLLEEKLGGIGERVDRTYEVAKDTYDDMQGMRDQLDRQSKELQHLSQLLAQLLEGRPAPIPSHLQPVRAEEPLPEPCPHGEWEVVRQLLGRCRTLSPGEQANPELVRVVDQLTQAAITYETTRRTVLHLDQTQDRGQLPIYPPPSRTATPVPTTNARISSLFFTGRPEDQSGTAIDVVPPPAPRRLLSSLFDQRANNENPEAD